MMNGGLNNKNKDGHTEALCGDLNGNLDDDLHDLTNKDH